MHECLNLHSRVDRPLITLRRLAIALPIVLVTRIAEEAPSFHNWFNAHVDQDASLHLYWIANGAVFVITTAVAHLLSIARDRISVGFALAWVGFSIFGNAVYHVILTFGDPGYVPGTVACVLLYLPYSFLVIRAAAIECLIPRAIGTALVVAGGIPLYIHGVMIAFEGRRLF